MTASGLGLIPNLLRATDATVAERQRVLVCIFQRGAMDGIAAVQPLTDASLRGLRPDLLLSAGTDRESLYDLDGRFGLHPSLRPLSRLFREEQLAIVHGVGLPTATRSHFDAQDYVESGTPGRKSTPDGWLNRAMAQFPDAGTPLRAVSLTPALPRSFYGEHYAIAVEQLADLGLRDDDTGGSTARSFEALYRQTTATQLRTSASSGLDAARLLNADAVQNYRPAAGVSYPDSALGRSLRQIAQLVKADVGLEVAFAESTGWDTHSRQGGAFGGFTRQARDLSGCIANFWHDLGPHRDRVTLVTMTEFGRTIAQNGSGGTDHGRASCLFVLGQGVKGGQVLGEVPTNLEPGNLEDGRDLPVTTDFREVFAAVAQHHVGGPIDTQALFPGWSGKPLRTLLRAGNNK